MLIMIERQIPKIYVFYNGSFAQLVCDYIRFIGMTSLEWSKVLEFDNRVKGA